MITVDQLTDIISEIQLVPRDDIKPDTSLDELGIDSLGALSIITEIESEYGIKVATDMPISGLTVATLVERLNQQQQNP